MKESIFHCSSILKVLQQIKLLFMKLNINILTVLMLLSIVNFWSCKKEDEADLILTVSVNELSFTGEGGDTSITVTCNDQWSISNPAYSWLALSQTSGESGSFEIKVSTEANAANFNRSDLLVVNSVNGQSRRINVSQGYIYTVPTIYPSYNTSPKEPDATGMSSNAVELAAKMKLGWNIGNTMEAPAVTGWGNPAITEDYVKFVKKQGFNAIRIPCAWDWNWGDSYSWLGDNYHIEDYKTARIKSDWLNRVKEVVGYCVNNDMYVLLNIHYDGGWLEHNVSKAKQDSVCAKQKALWEQIATAMRNFDEHLMFASANEPAADNAEEVGVLTLYHQIFINAVRSTGGRNSYRVLVLQGPNTSMSMTPELMTTLPNDPVPNRLMVEVHNYTPSQFCILNEDADWGKMFYYWGNGHHSTIEPDRNATYGEENAVAADFQKMREAFVDKGIPVIIGEYGAPRRNNSENVPLDLETHNDAVDYWITFMTQQAISNGMIPFWWDTGGALDRTNYTVKDQRTIDAIIAGSK
jgi:endoglucanase